MTVMNNKEPYGAAVANMCVCNLGQVSGPFIIIGRISLGYTMILVRIFYGCYKGALRKSRGGDHPGP